MVHFKMLGMNVVKDGMSWAMPQTKTKLKPDETRPWVQLSTLKYQILAFLLFANYGLRMYQVFILEVVRHRVESAFSMFF